MKVSLLLVITVYILLLATVALIWATKKLQERTEELRRKQNG